MKKHSINFWIIVTLLLIGSCIKSKEKSNILPDSLNINFSTYTVLKYKIDVKMKVNWFISDTDIVNTKHIDKKIVNMIVDDAVEMNSLKIILNSKLTDVVNIDKYDEFSDVMMDSLLLNDIIKTSNTSLNEDGITISNIIAKVDFKNTR